MIHLPADLLALVHSLAEVMQRAGCSQAWAERAVDAVGMDVARAVEWLRARALC